MLTLLEAMPRCVSMLQMRENPLILPVRLFFQRFALLICPILSVLSLDIMGGINLGIGGLIRAYGQCARECLQNAAIENRIFYQNMYLKVNYPDIGTVVTLCKRVGGESDRHKI